ncbi:MAG: hypothetical protein NT065_03900 [Chlamydiae bacterium]|nr:hypothetical protein [Chlamydiota bacterium]
MRIVTCFLLAWTILCGASESLSQSELDQLNDYITTSWEGDEEDVWLRCDIGEGLERVEDYNTNQMSNGQSVEFHLKPVLPGSVLFFTEGEVEEIICTVTLNNTSHSSRLDYQNQINVIYTQMNAEGQQMRWDQSYTFTGSFKNPRLDLSSKPSLFIINDENNEFVIVFKNSLPYSKKSRNK